MKKEIYGEQTQQVPIKASYDTVGITSILLNEMLDELKAAQNEKETILTWIQKITEDGTLEQNAAEIRTRMSANLERFKKVIAEISSLALDMPKGAVKKGLKQNGKQ
jgi:DNA-directed RNA polymerase specialized sigma54-like protein